MAEGDTVHAMAGRLGERLAGRALTRTDFLVPRFATADLSERTVREVVARGKHLLIRTDRDGTIHSHLGMNGSWTVYATGERWRGSGLRGSRRPRGGRVPRRGPPAAASRRRRHGARGRGWGPDLVRIVELVRSLMEANRDGGRRVTTGDRRRGHELWVYGRRGRPCRRCGAPVQRIELVEREAYLYPSCQRRSDG